MNIIGRILATTAALAVSYPAGPAQGAPGDPPSRVGRLAGITGTVSYHLANADHWEAATLNLPLTDGAAVWTEPGSRAEVGVGGNRITLDASTEFDVDRLDDHALVATQPQGASYMRLRVVPTGDSYTIATPRGIVAVAAVGRYEVVSGDLDHPTTVTVIEGAAQVTGIPNPAQVGPNQTLTINGDGSAKPFTVTIGPAARDAFLTAVLAAERPIQRPAAAPAFVARMTGSEALDEYGEWATTPEYGAIWYPPAESGFVPYRNGHWAYVQPWGWTWVDDAPWGFAPTHYGRWVETGGRWGWLPGAGAGPNAVPVYAPAVVGFLGGAAAGALVGWAPLGPRELYRPPYRASPQYLQALNRPNAPGGAGGPPPLLVNRAAVTAVPAAVMAGSQAVAQAARPLPPALAQGPARVQFRPPVAPTPATAGVTPAASRQLGLPPSAPTRPLAPGPSLRPAAPGRAVPSLAAEPVRPSAPGPAMNRPGAIAPVGTPQLRPNEPARSPEPRPGAPGPAIAHPAAPVGPELSRPGAIGPEARRPNEPARLAHPAAPTAVPLAHPDEAPAIAPPGAIAPRPTGPEATRPAAPHVAPPPPRIEPRPAAPVPHPAAPQMQAPHPVAPPHPVPPPPQARPAPPPQARPMPPPPQAHPAAPPHPQSQQGREREQHHP